MSHAVVTSPCIGTKDGACTKVCPVSCFFDGGELLLIHPEECTHCGLCVPECPVNAIHFADEVPETEQAFIQRAHDFFKDKSAEELEKLRVGS